MARSVTTASREEYLGYALESEIRSRIHSRHWYRKNRTEHPWEDLERENTLILRELFRVRRDALRQFQSEQDRVTRAWREMKAAHDAVLAGQWAEAVATGQYPDVPLAMTPDPGDVFVYPAGVGR